MADKTVFDLYQYSVEEHDVIYKYILFIYCFVRNMQRICLVSVTTKIIYLFSNKRICVTPSTGEFVLI